MITSYYMRNPKGLMSEWGGGESNPHFCTILVALIDERVLIKPSLQQSSRIRRLIIRIIQKHNMPDRSREKLVPLWGYIVLFQPAFRGLAPTYHPPLPVSQHHKNINLSHPAPCTRAVWLLSDKT